MIEAPYGQMFHLGFIVDDVETSASGLSDVFGVHWTPVEQRVMSLRGPDGPQKVQMEIVYSREGPVHLELIKSVPGTHWQTSTAPLTPHHVGVWCDDLGASSGQLADQQVPMIMTYDADHGGVSGFAYHRLANGMFVELLDAARRPGFDAWFAGGPFPGDPAVATRP